jgi:DNA-binding NtrC family response regulator
VHLPLVDAPLDPPADGTSGAEPIGLGRRETILLVEDDESLRPLFTSALEAEGYTVVAAASGEDALAGDVGAAELLISDIVMPGMGGVALARELTSRRPGLRVLLISGFSEHGVGDEELRELDASFLRKPFTLAELSAKARGLLDAVPAG